MDPTRWLRVEEVYQAAANRKPEERAAFLALACAGDEDLRHEAEALLAQPSADCLLDRPAWEAETGDRLPPDALPLTAGQRLSHYRIQEKLGEGGMGVVYRATDTKLGRDVAIKVLPERFAADTDRMARFAREARVLASLNHPNIAQIYGVEEHALVMEFVEGKALPARLSLDTALHYAKQIAEALEYAHEGGIIHRDLKPANLKITSAGTVKLLDFGLAKGIEAPSGLRDDGDSPMLTGGVTREGLILGTAAYMSPEQANGKTADRRSDIWSFGAMLFEMLSGKRAFKGESVSDTLATVLKLDPDWNALPAETPASIRKLIQRCLTKDRKQRLQAIGEARIAIEDSLSGAPTQTSQPMSPRRSIIPWAVAGVLTVALTISLWALWRAALPVEQQLVRLDVDLGRDISLRPINAASSVIISPDGTRLVYVASAGGGPLKLFTRKLDQPNTTELPGTDGAVFPFISPDGRWVGFATPLNKMTKVSVEGGAVAPLDGIGTNGASWGEDGSILEGPQVGVQHGLIMIPAGGGPATLMTELATGELYHEHPQILPGGKAALFTASAAVGAEVDRVGIEVVSFPDRRRKVLVRRGASPHYVPTSKASGHLVYSFRGTLFAIPFDLKRLETRGTAVPVLDGVAFNAVTGTADFDVSRTGTLVYRKGSGGATAGMRTIQWLDAAGNKQPLLAKPGPYATIRLSPDGKRVTVEVIEASGQDIWVYDLQRDAMIRLTFGGGVYRQANWSPDGRYIVFTSAAGGIFWTRADGAGQPQPLIQSKNLQLANAISPDGKRLPYMEAELGSQHWQIWTVPIDDSGGQLRAGKPERFFESQYSAVGPLFSPDGKWMSYRSNESGKTEVYVRPFPPPANGQGGKWQISNNGGAVTRWSRNGHELYYWSGDQMMAVNYKVKGDVFMPEKPRVWIPKLGRATWVDVGPDEKHVAVELPVDTAEAPEHELTLLFNFADELRRHVPLGN